MLVPPELIQWFGRAAALSWMKLPLQEQMPLAVQYSAYIQLALFLLSFAIVLLLYRPLSALRLVDGSRATTTSVGSNLLIGAGMGLLLTAISLPFVIRAKSLAHLEMMALSCTVCVKTFVMMCILGIVYPIATQVLFSKIVYRTLTEDTGPVMSVVLTGLLFMLLWPLYGSIAALIVGLGTTALYSRSRSLAAATVANGVFCVATIIVPFLG